MEKLNQIFVVPFIATMLLVVTTTYAESPEATPQSTGVDKSVAVGAAVEQDPAIKPVVTAGDQADGFVQRMIGARGAISHEQLSGAPAQPLLGGGMLYERGMALLAGELISTRYLDELWIGYDGGGVTYSLSAQLGIGMRWDVAPQLGPFVRFEMRGEMKRQGGWYYSSLRLPGAQVGFGGVRELWNWELLAHGGAALTGRLRAQDVGRSVAGGVLGAALSVAFSGVRLDADLSHVGLASQLGGIWDARMHLCSYWGERPAEHTYEPHERDKSEFRGAYEAEFPLAICADASFLANPGAVSQQLAPQQQTVLGLTFLVGRALRLDPAGGTCEEPTRHCGNSGGK